MLLTNFRGCRIAIATATGLAGLTFQAAHSGLLRSGFGLADSDSYKGSSFYSLKDFPSGQRPDILLTIPRSYVVATRQQSINRISGSLNFYITFPDMKGGLDPANKDIASCSGYCRGLTSITLRNSSNHGELDNSDVNRFLSDRQTYQLIRSGTFSSRYDEYDVIWRRNPFSRVATGANGISYASARSALAVKALPSSEAVASNTYETYNKHPWPAAHIFVFNQGSSKQNVIRCQGFPVLKGQSINGKSTSSAEMTRPSCSYFERFHNPDTLTIQFVFPYNLMQSWPEFHSSITNLVKSFIVTTPLRSTRLRRRAK